MARSVKREHEAILARRGGGSQGAFLRISRIVETTPSEGPGERFALWVQGCTKRCQRCCNPEMWPLDGGHLVPISEVMCRIESIASDIDGITILGGEPFLQAEALAVVAGHAAHLDLGVVVFTGFELEALLDEHDYNVRKLIESADLLIDGPYRHDRRSARRRWIGSDNQRMHFLSERYRDHPDMCDDALQSVHVAVSGWSSLARGGFKLDPEG